MAHYKGRIVEILLEGYQNAAARLSCPEVALPRPGQYLQAHQADDPMEVAPTSLYAAGETQTLMGEISLPVSGNLPAAWQPGTELLLRGPLGRGFELPKRAHRVALVALDRNPGRLLPLVGEAIEQGAGITLFSDTESGDLPLSVEQQGLKDLPSGIRWADYLAADVPVEKVEELDSIFRSKIPAALGTQILVAAPMPCGELAQCGICTVRTQRGPRLACEDGPVFKLQDLV